MKSEICNICLEETDCSFTSLYRPKSCTCGYSVHKDCYDKWLTSSDRVYNCIICHQTVSLLEIQQKILDEKKEREAALLVEKEEREQAVYESRRMLLITASCIYSGAAAITFGVPVGILAGYLLLRRQF
jgi:hypothetical protein